VKVFLQRIEQLPNFEPLPMKFTTRLTVAHFTSPLGRITLAASPLGLAGAWFDGQKHLPAELGSPGVWPVDESQSVLREAAAQLSAYFAGRLAQFDLPLDLSSGTAFQQHVWRALLAIPPGYTRSYGQIGVAVGLPQASSGRAVGAAVGRNPISIIVPCHRVLGSGGSLTGYAGGLERKTALLRLEQTPVQASRVAA
jgi:methylated-DNA-[protein]-cysteine S-methyltransferase